MADSKPKSVSFPSGDSLSGVEGAPIVRSAPTSIVVVAGMVGSGKTTLIGELYGLFHRKPFAGFYFAGSQTLPGFERRAHLARLASEREVPDTERTAISALHDLLHLRLRGLDGACRDILFSDIYGEAFRLAADSAEECRKLPIIKRADHLAVLVDGRKAIDKSLRQDAFASADSLVRQCVDSGMLNRNSNVQVVVTKWDEINGRGDDFINQKLNWLATRYRDKLAGFSTHKAALRTTGEIVAGFGMGDLLRIWIEVRKHHLSPDAVQNSKYHSEFDRLATTWPIAMIRRSNE